MRKDEKDDYVEFYAESGGAICCPFCESFRVFSDSEDVASSEAAWVPWRCQECDGTWHDRVIKGDIEVASCGELSGKT